MGWLIRKIIRDKQGRALAYLLLLFCMLFSFLFLLPARGGILVSGPKTVSEKSKALMSEPVQGAIKINQDLGGLEKKYKVQFGTDEVEVGDFTSPEFRPQSKFKRWGD